MPLAGPSGALKIMLISGRKVGQFVPSSDLENISSIQGLIAHLAPGQLE
jgi:hypothetical protein